MAREVFICYANQDKTVAEAVCSKLEDNGIQCWIAPRDVSSGKNWDDAIMEALSQSRIVVLVFSASSNDSEYCINEVHAAFNRREEIIPLLIDNTTPNRAMELYLQRKQWLDAQEPPLEPHLNKLVNEVKGHLAQFAAREEAAARAKKEAEEAAREKARQEAKTARAREEEVVTAKEKAQQEAEATRIKKEAEESRKEKARQEAEAARARREAEKARRALEKRKPRKARVIWLSAGSGVLLAGLGIIWVLLGTGPKEKEAVEPTTPISSVMSENVSTPTPTPEPSTTAAPEPPTTAAPEPSTTAAPEPAPALTTQGLDEYIQLNFGTVTFSNNEIKGRMLFYATIKGTVQCTKDLLLPVSQARVIADITARLADKGTEVTLARELTITVKPFPVKQGEMFNITEEVGLQFPSGAASGQYNISAKIVSVSASADGSFWYDVTSYLPPEQEIGRVTYTAE